MSRKERGIHPKLIVIMTGVEPPPDETPTVAMLPGETAVRISKRCKKITLEYKPNNQRLRCSQCGHASVYDIGMTVFDGERWKQALENSGDLTNDDASFDITGRLLDNAQFTGYIRCTKCNGAGKWEFTSALFKLGLMGRIMRVKEKPDAGFMFGLIQLHDGSTPQWISEAEERFLEQLENNPTDSYLWNKLGNLYLRGGRPELAAVAFEYSLKVDESYVESHYSLADMLLQIGELELAAEHLRQTLVYAHLCTRLDALKLRSLLADSLSILMDIHHDTKGKVPVLPTEEERVSLKQVFEAAAGTVPELHLYEFEMHPGDLESILPVAEMYMGTLTDGISEDDRKLRKHKSMGPLERSGEQAMSNGKVGYSEKGWGSERQPIIVKVRTEQRAVQVARVCDHFNWHYIMGMELTEDLSDLKKALQERLAPANVYDPCPCGSGVKHKFCCAKTMKNFDLNEYLKSFVIEASS